MKLKIGIAIGLILAVVGAGFLFFAPPTVSVVMPVYNRETFVTRAIDSILQQTYRDFEFIIIDDGSTDKTVEIIRRFAAKDRRIKLFQNAENKGISYTRNRGMDLARGKYLYIMDSDDYAMPNAIQLAVEKMKAHPDIAFTYPLCRMEMTDRDGSHVFTTPPLTIDKIFHFNVFRNVGNMVRLSFVRAHNIRYNENLLNCEDFQFWVDILKASGKPERIPALGIVFRYHQTNSDAYYTAMTANHNKVVTDLMNWLKIPTDIQSDMCAVAHYLTPDNQPLFTQQDIDRLKETVCAPTRP